MVSVLGDRARTRVRKPLDSLQQDPTHPTRHVDWILLALTGVLCLFGLAVIYSARRRALLEAGDDPYTFVKRQVIALCIGGVMMAVAARVDYRRVRELTPLIYLGTLALLAAVVSPLGTQSNGAQAWFQVGSFQFQPAEFAKAGLIVTLAAVAAGAGGVLDQRRLVSMLMLAALPAGLVLLQPDLGSVLVLVALTLGILLVGGAQPRHMAVLALLAAVSVVAVFQTDTLEEYQRDRLRSFVNPDSDAAYQQEQSKIAIGAGGLTGQGYLDGTQTNLSYVPEQHTDFIFTVVGEELGLVGAGSLLTLYGLMAWRIWRVAKLARDLFGTLLCAGVLSMLAFQAFENIGMTMGIMPITGLPLPLLSYGGSATMAFLLMLGLVQSVHMHRFT